MPRGIYKRTSQKHKEMIRLMGLANKGKKRGPHSEETKEKMRQKAIGRKPSIETRLKMGLSRRGNKHCNWKGGVTKEYQIIRGSIEYKLWRETVFKRDKWTCVWCGYRSKGSAPTDIHADHIKPFALYPELRFCIDNGRTLCIPCHKTTESYLNNTIKRVYQLL